MGPLSFSNRYRVRPLASASTVPSRVCAVDTDAAAAGLAVAAAAPYAPPPAAVGVDDAPPHPAAMTASAAGATATMSGRFTVRLLDGRDQLRGIVVLRSVV